LAEAVTEQLLEAKPLEPMELHPHLHLWLHQLAVVRVVIGILSDLTEALAVAEAESIVQSQGQ
jgi:hypothetical protein